MTAAAFELTSTLPAGRTLIEASAGTGKTYSIAVLVARFVAGELGPSHDLTEGVGIDEVLVVTYTRAAAWPASTSPRSRRSTGSASRRSPRAYSAPAAAGPRRWSRATAR